jgi:polyphosphate kinase 2 (PPK2 family)
MLDTIDLSFAISKQTFKPMRREMLRRIFELSEMVYERKRPVIIVFEGWDAAGKGTTIRALTQQLDARGYKVLPTQAARTHEKQKPWLWRFWMNIPRYGQIAIFDRSWYGRVLVERVEGLTPMPEWIAAYEEINQFERTLTDDGTVFIKFWLHISKEEQLRRFMELSLQPETAWQVAAEDWDHHRKYDEYLAAVRDMLASTSTQYAPWTVVPSTDREYRLYTVFRTIISRLEEALGLAATDWPEPEAVNYEGKKAVKKTTKQAASKADKQDAKKAEKKAKRAAKLEEQEDHPKDSLKVGKKPKKAKKTGQPAQPEESNRPDKAAKKSKKKKATKDSLAAADDSGSADDNWRGAAERLEELAALEEVKDAQAPSVPAKKRGNRRKAVSMGAVGPPATDDSTESIPDGAE